MSVGDQTPLTLIRIKDPNEALGLAVRLIAAVPPFNEFPLGTSVASLISAIDHSFYAFVRRGDRAVGFAGWGFARQEVAEEWAFKRRAPRQPEDFLEGPCVLIFGMQAISSDVARYLCRRLRDDVFRNYEVVYYIRDYGPQPDGSRRLRTVRLKRPAVRRQPAAAAGASHDQGGERLG